MPNAYPWLQPDKNYHFEAFGIPRKSSHHKFRWYGWTEGYVIEQPWGCTQFSSNVQSQVIASSNSIHPISAFLAKLGHHTHPMREACQLHCIGIHEICLWGNCTAYPVGNDLSHWERGSKRVPTHRIACVFESLCKQSESIWFHSTSGTFSFDLWVIECLMTLWQLQCFRTLPHPLALLHQPVSVGPANLQFSCWNHGWHHVS